MANTQGLHWKQHLNIFLREYRSTLHSTTESSPAELPFQQKMFTKIPSFTNAASNSSDTTVRSNDNKAKSKMKAHADSHRHAKLHTLTLGDTVLYRQPKQNKLTSPYNNMPYTVTKIRGSMVAASRRGHSIIRNSSFFKKVVPDLLHIPMDLDGYSHEQGDDSSSTTTSTQKHSTPRYPATDAPLLT